MIIAATGHRPQRTGGFGRKAFLRLFDVAFVYLRNFRDTMPYPQARELVTMCGMAQGWDQAFASASDALGIPFIAAVPFEGQDRRWLLEGRRRYGSLLKKALRVEVVTPGSTDEWPHETFVSAFQKRNEFMVDRASLICALWDGKPSGGTANCVAYALGSQKPVVNLYSEWKALESP
jgi:hypothetical protein